MTLAKGILKSSLYGLLTGSLLATTTFLWFNFSNPFLLPVLVALWWLAIFGGNLLHVYKLSNSNYSNTRKFGLQLVHAGVAAGIFWAIDFAVSPAKSLAVSINNTQPRFLYAGISPSVHDLLTDTTVIVPAAFLLSIITSGLLFSILSRPAAK